MSKAVLSFALATLVGAASAAPVYYAGENQSPGGGVSGNPVIARAAFLSQLTGVSSEGFESFSTGTTVPLALNFTGAGGSTLTATLSGNGTVFNSPFGGRYNTTPGGTNFFEVDGVGFTINFGTAISAFGFYGTDIGDFAGQLTMTLTDTKGQTTTVNVPHTVGASDGSLLFFGFVDTSNAYTRITFSNTGGVGDTFGFDDMVIGAGSQIKGAVVDPGVPEPGSLALAGLALAGLGWARLRRRG